MITNSAARSCPSARQDASLRPAVSTPLKSHSTACPRTRARLGGGIPAIAAMLFRLGRNDAPQPVGRTADTQFGLLADDLRVGRDREADAETEEGDERRKPQTAHHGLAPVIDEGNAQGQTLRT